MRARYEAALTAKGVPSERIHKYENERIYELILRYASRTRTVKQSNDTLFRLVTASYVLYILAIVLLTVLLIMTVSI